MHKICLSFLFLLFMFGCSATLADEEISKPNPLYVDPTSLDFSSNTDLLDRVTATPHGYFRFINIPFSQEICRRLKENLVNMPSINLHGDAHLEQYAITDIGRGLTDFDDASTGPAVIDIMRIGVSTHLVALENGWQNLADSLFNTFLGGYESALENPELDAPEPIVVKRIREKFSIDRKGYFKWISTVMQPMDPAKKDSLITALDPYIQTKIAEKPERGEAYFKVVDCGYLHMGIGSALDMKFLIRIAGPSEDPLDDIILECKEVRDLSDIHCIDSGREKDPFRILVGQTRIAYSPFKHLGYFRFRGQNFWVHSWVDNYKELKIKGVFQSPQEFKEVLYDVGVQLGKGHVKHIAYPLDLQLRREQLRLLRENRNNAINLCAELAQLTVAAWDKFRVDCQK